MQKPASLTKSRPRTMTGEIIDQRFAVLERTGPDRYLVFDMQTLRRVQLQLLLNGTEYLVVDNGPAAPARSAPPPLPAALSAAPPPSPAAALEAAWFAHGERFADADEQGGDFVAEDEVPDYPRYQQLLEQIAEELSAALFAKYALERAE